MSALGSPPAPAEGAVCLDGRRFSARVTEGRVQPGDLVVLEPPGEARQLGQVLDFTPEPRWSTSGSASGLVLGTLDDADTLDRKERRPFRWAGIAPATRAQVERLQEDSGATLDIGTWRVGEREVPLRLRPQGFGRHTFLCGQSGSGKTYALGVVLEQLVLGTGLRMAVLDPNSDFVRIRETVPGAPAAAAERFGAPDIRVLRPDATGAGRLFVRFAAMPRRVQAAAMRMDAVTDREEFNAWLTFARQSAGGWRSVQDIIDRLKSGTPAERQLGMRIENIGVADWSIFPDELGPGESPAMGSRVTVLDLGGFRFPPEAQVVAVDLLERLWAERESRQPTLIVIDEAHNVCAAQPETALQAALTERVIQIAAEGRKFGLWLFLSTQRPSKIHPQVLSQCDNLLLMRMNSPGDLEELAVLFGYAPPALLRASPHFTQGEALVAGAFVPVPSIGRMGRRLTVEGGVDVRVPMP